MQKEAKNLVLLCFPGKLALGQLPPGCFICKVCSLNPLQLSGS